MKVSRGASRPGHKRRAIVIAGCGLVIDDLGQVGVTRANMIPESVKSITTAAACDTRESSDDKNREAYGGGEEGLLQWDCPGFALRQGAENTEPGPRVLGLSWLPSLSRCLDYAHHKCRLFCVVILTVRRYATISPSLRFFPSLGAEILAFDGMARGAEQVLGRS